MQLDDWVLCRIHQKSDTTKKFSHEKRHDVKQNDSKRLNDQSEYLPSDLEQEGYVQYVGATNGNDQVTMQQHCPMANSHTSMRRVVTVATMEELLMSNNRLDQFNPVDSEASHIFD